MSAGLFGNRWYINSASTSENIPWDNLHQAKIQISLHICGVWSESSPGVFWIVKDAISSCGQQRMIRLCGGTGWFESSMGPTCQKVRFLTLLLNCVSPRATDYIAYMNDADPNRLACAPKIFVVAPSLYTIYIPGFNARLWERRGYRIHWRCRFASQRTSTTHAAWNTQKQRRSGSAYTITLSVYSPLREPLYTVKYVDKPRRTKWLGLILFVVFLFVFLFASKQAHAVGTTSIQRWFNVLTLNQRWIDIVSTVCVCWDMT